MKKAFTLAELMVCLLLIGVITAITIPILSNATPNKNAYLYKAAFRTLERAVSAAINDESQYVNGEFKDKNNTTSFCLNIVNSLNTIGTVNCNVTSVPTSGSTPATYNFMTSNGMKWWGFNNNFNVTATKTVFVDIQGTDSGKLNEDIFRMNVNNTGKISIPSSYTKEVNYLSSE